MTIENQQRRIVYDADGVSLAYPVPFPFLEPEWLTVSVGTGEIGTTDTTLVYGVDYEVTGAGDPIGGAVILSEPQPVGMKIAISRWVPITQEEVYPEGGKFPTETTENCFDKLTMICQQVEDWAVSNSMLPGTSTETGTDVVNWIDQRVQAADASANAAKVSEDNAAASAEAAAQSEANAAGSAANAHADADRAAALVDQASLASSVFNVRKALVAEQDTPSGGIITLPGYYYPTRDVLYLTYDGLVCTPRISGVEASGEYQYEEVGTDRDVPSNEVKVWFDVAAGEVLDMWVVASAAGRNIEEIKALVAQAAAYSLDAEGSAQDAAGQVLLASAQADRAEDEADRAEAAANSVPDVNTAQDGQVPVARNVGGTMVAEYENPPSPQVTEQRATLASVLAAGAEYTVPQYIVGSNKLQVYAGGLHYDRGPDSAKAQYQEVGTTGAASTIIKFYDDQPAGTQINVSSAG